jgi:mono/diheme cytochrome c family protein
MNSSRLWYFEFSKVPKPGFFLATFLGCALTFTSCTKNESKSLDAASTSATATAALVQRGKVLYQTQCIACHNSDPRKPGALGPDVFNSSRELLDARILRAEYPQGYKPKRETHTMVALPHLKNELEAIHSYLNSN